MHYYWGDTLLHEVFASPAWTDHELLELRLLSSRCKRIVDSILEQRFLERWELAVVRCPPPTPAGFAAASLRHFAHRRRLGATPPSLFSIALETGSDVGLLRRVNNIISDHSLAARDAVFIPVGAGAELRGKAVGFEFCRASLRHWAVVLPESEDIKSIEDIDNGVLAPRSSKVVELVQKALGTDAATAAFYLDSAGGDVRAAMAAHEEDQRWERSMKGVRRALSKASKRCGRRIS